MSHKVWLQTDPPVPSHDAADHKGVSAVISCVHLAIRFSYKDRPLGQARVWEEPKGVMQRMLWDIKA